MASPRNELHERFFNSLIGGDRAASRQIVDQAIDSGSATEKIMTHLFWHALEHIQNLYRNDQLSELSHHYATRLLRQLVDQMQLRLEQAPRRGQTILVVSGNDDAEELSAQIGADLLEADGYTVYYAGGGIGNDEIVEQLGHIRADKLVVFAAIPRTVPYTRLLIDRLHEIGVCPKIQIVLGGGVFNRADGLAEEIGADLWANDPAELVEVINEEPNRRMTADQRTVGRRRRSTKHAAA